MAAAAAVAIGAGVYGWLGRTAAQRPSAREAVTSPPPSHPADAPSAPPVPSATSGGRHALREPRRTPRAAGPSSMPAALARKIESAVDRVPRCVAELGVQSDALWALDLAQGLLEHPQLGPMVDGRKRAIDATSPLGVLLDPDAAPYRLPADVEARPLAAEGKLFLTLLDALACRDGDAPSERLRAFVDDRHEGYLLAHQFLAIEWATRVGCAVPGTWPARQDALVDAVLGELRASKAFSDLFVEQLFVVTLAGRSADVAPEWIERVVAAQGKDGCWTDAAPTEIRFGDGAIVSTQGPDHTTGLALYAVARYRHDRR